MKSSCNACYLLVMVLLAAPWLPAAEQAAPGAVDPLNDAIRHAKSYYLLGSVEAGNLTSPEAGLRQVAQAETLLAALLKSKCLSPGEDERYQMHIRAVKSDLLDQLTTAQGTLVGVFPLTPFVLSPLFAESGPSATYRLNDDPACKAAADAAANLTGRLSDSDKKQVALPVLVCGLVSGQAPLERARGVKQAVRRVFSGSSHYQLLDHADVAAVLSTAEWDRLRAGDVAAARSTLAKSFGPKLLVVTLRPSDSIDDVRAYTATGDIVERSGSSSAKVQQPVSAVGVARERRDRLAWILWANAGLLAAAYVLYASIVHTHRARAADSSWVALVALPLVAFAVGHSMPLAIAPLLGSMRLPPDSPAILSFWLPCLAGLGFLAAPLLVYWLIAPWGAQLWTSLSPSGRGGALFAAMGTGIAAYLAGPLLLYLDEHMAVELLLTCTSVVTVTYLLGRALDYTDSLPLTFAFVPLVLTMLVGAASLHASAAWLGLATAVVLATLALTVVWSTWRSKRRAVHGGTAAGSSDIAANIPADVQALARCAENPLFQPSPTFAEAWEHVSGLLDGRCCHLGLFGGRGAGKTATAAALADRLTKEFKKRSVAPAFLCGACPQPVGEPISYAPFCQALAQHFEVNLLAPPGPKLQQISQALGGLFGSVIPFTRILFPHSSGNGNTAARPEELNASIAWMLRRLAKSRPVLLYLDDVQWLDEASAALLEYLLEEFPADSKMPLAILLVAHSESSLADLGLGVGRAAVEIPYPSLARQAEILVRGVGLQESVAQEILVRCGAERKSEGGLLWPLQVTARLARCGALVRAEQGFGWAGGHWPADFAIPDHMQAAIQQQWESASAYRTILECAACGCSGRDFRASVVAQALGKPYLDILLTLDEIEHKTGMIHDLRDRDDLYAFHSTFLLEVIRSKLGIGGHGPAHNDVPQIVREYHARLASVFEGSLQTSTATLYEVANHFYAAGTRHAAKGADYSLHAADTSAAACDFRRALRYLDMAEECAGFVSGGPAIEPQRHVIRCRQAAVTLQGDNRRKVATEEWEYLQAHLASPANVMLAVAEICYEVGHRDHLPQWREKAASLCQQVLATGASLLETVQSRHLNSLCQPSSQHAQRIAGVREALALLANAPPEDREASLNLARIMVSLAIELSKGTPAEQAEARRLFQDRLQLEEPRQLDNLRGVAMAVAGLGRLELYGEPRDIAAACAHFQRALELYEAVGNVVGQVKMHSLLGACAVEAEDLPQALLRYQQSWEMAADPIDSYYAAAGLLQCHRRQNQAERFACVVDSLLTLLRRQQESTGGVDEIPAECKQQLQAALTAYSSENGSESICRLLALVQS